MFTRLFRKQIIQAQKEYKKKKAQKKAQRMKQLEDEREKEKLKWHSFNAKVIVNSVQLIILVNGIKTKKY